MVRSDPPPHARELGARRGARSRRPGSSRAPRASWTCRAAGAATRSTRSAGRPGGVPGASGGRACEHADGRRPRQQGSLEEDCSGRGRRRRGRGGRWHRTRGSRSVCCLGAPPPLRAPPRPRQSPRTPRRAPGCATRGAATTRRATPKAGDGAEGARDDRSSREIVLARGAALLRSRRCSLLRRARRRAPPPAQGRTPVGALRSRREPVDLGRRQTACAARERTSTFSWLTVPPTDGSARITRSRDADLGFAHLRSKQACSAAYGDAGLAAGPASPPFLRLRHA